MPHDSSPRSPKKATPSPHNASNPWGDTRSTGSHRATDVLRAVLGDAGLPAGDAAVYEGLAALARAAQAIAGWSPDSHIWRDVASHLDEQTAARVSERNAYSSGIAPSRLNPLYGDFRTFPLYAGLVAGAQVPASTAWNFVAGLACWPFMHATLHGFPPPKATANVVSAIYPLLREISTSPTTLRWLDGLLDGVTSPAGLLEAITRLPSNDRKSGRAKGLAELAHQFVLGHEAPATQAPEDEDDLPPPVYGTLLEKTRQDDAPNDLAPEEWGAAQSVLEIEGDTDPAIVRARTIGAARDFNHLHLRWEALTSEEVEYFATAYPTLIQDESTRSAAIGLAISAAAGIPLQELAGIRLATCLDQGRAFAIASGIAIAPLNGTLAMISSAPALENAFKQAGKDGSFLPVSPVKLTALPTSCASALQGSGLQPGETLARRFPTLAADARVALAAMRQKSGLRLTPGRLHPAIAKRIYTHTQDECVASLIHPAARIAVGAGRYYLALTCQEIADIHCHAAQSLFPGDVMPLDLPPDMKHTYVGSQLVVEGDEIACALTSWRNRLEGKIKTGRRNVASVAEALNAHFIWLAMLIRLLAFVRPVIAPLPRPCDLDPAQGFLLACDKRESIRNEQRLVPLAGVVSEQIALTQETLTSAALYFDRHAPELAAKIRSLQVYGSACASIPALPYLEQQGSVWQFRELRPEDASWPEIAWPANFGRHFGIQMAHKNRLPREVVSMLVGHAETGQTPFGWDSVLTPHDLKQICRPFLDELAGTLKLKTLPALPRHSLGVDEQPPQHVHIPLFGDDRPDRNARRHLTLAEKQHLRNVGIHFATIATYSPEEAMSEVARVLKSGSTRSPSELHWLRKVAERYLRFRQKATSTSQRDQTLKVPLEADAGTVERGELLLFNRGQQARGEITRLTDTFLRASPEKAEPPKWIALIAVNAIAFGGCLHTKAAEGIAKACVAGVRTFDGNAFLDWKTDAGEFRFWADAQTSALIARWLDTRTSTPGDLDLDAFRQELRLLLAQITALADVPYAWPASKTRLSRLRLAIGAYMRHYVPGVLMAHMQGVRRSAPVRITCLQRELGLYQSLPSMQAEPLTPRSTSINARATTSAEGAIAALRKKIAKIRPTSATGGASKGTRGDRLRSLEADLNALEASLNLLARDHGDSAITHIVIARTRHLASKGGRLKKNLATSTISEYLAPVLRFAECPAGRQILTADPSELAEAYRTIILSGTPTKANMRYRSLADFHALATEQFGVEDIDWNEIVGDIPGIKVRVDTNLIFPHEVDLTLSLLESAPDVPDDLRLRAMLAVSLMADLGLRFGEVFRLRHKHLPAGRRFLYIRNTRDGEVKTHNGTRVIPFDVLATARTKELMDGVMALTDPEGKLAGDAALFGAIDNPQELIPRAVLARLANQALRTATGDPTTRLHHLRHAVATRLFDQIVLPESRDRSAALLKEIVGTTDPTRRALYSLAMLLGHGNGQTTTTSYVHQQERRVTIAMNRLPARTPDRFLATVIKQSEAAIRTYRSRGKNQADILLAYARKVFTRIPSLDVAHEAKVTTPPTILKAGWIAGMLEGSLAQIDRILRLQFRSGLAPSAAAMLSGVTDSFASTLATMAKDIARELLLPSDELGTPEAFLSPRSLCGNNRTWSDAIENIERTDESIQLAAFSLRSYDYGQYAWVCRDGYALKAILSWISLAGIEPTDISIRVPANRWDEVEGYVPRIVYAAAQVLPVDSRAQRTRGADPFEVTVNATGAGSTGSRFVHATYLQLIRWHATP